MLCYLIFYLYYLHCIENNFYIISKMKNIRWPYVRYR